MELLDVGVVGAGFAGMAAALFLARDGHRVTLYERAASPGPVGAAIVLQPSGLSVLAALGLEQRVTAQSGLIDRLHVRSPQGKTIVDLRYATLNAAWYGLGVGRGVLFDALWGALAGAGVSVRTGVEIVAAPLEGERRVIVADAPIGQHDLVVVADGARSRVAQSMPGRSVRPYRWGALFFVGACPDASELQQIADGSRRFMGVLPMGGRRASLFWSLRADRLDAWRRGFAAWREEALHMGPEGAPLIEAITEPEQVLFAPYADVRMKRWSGTRIVAIGDAAHATSPQLGQGSNLALWDALILARCIREHPFTNALTTYDALRRRHLVYYQRATRWLTPLFQGDLRLLGWLRDVGFPIGQRLGPIRRLMTASMAGVAAGFLGRREELPAPWPG